MKPKQISRRLLLVFLFLTSVGMSRPAWSFNVLVDFHSTADGRLLNHGDLIAGTEWLSLGVRFVGQNLHIIADATCPACLGGENIAVTFVLNGQPAVTDVVFANYVNSPNASTVVVDINSQILFEGPGDLDPPLGLQAPDIVFVGMVAVGDGLLGFGFNSVTPPGGFPPGSSQDNPVLPSEQTLPPSGVFNFINAIIASWVDPPLATGYEYEMLSDSRFTGILDFPAGFADRFTVTHDGVSLAGSFGPGDSAIFPGGAQKFTITGIAPAVDAQRPDAFPIRLLFDTAIASFTMRPIVSVPDRVARLCSILGNDPPRLDQDIFRFNGAKNERVVISLVKNAAGGSEGDRATLLLVDAVRGATLIRADNGTIPNQVSATLPRAGRYYVVVGEQPRIGRTKPFRGAYCVTLESSAGAHQTLGPQAGVE